MEHSSVKWPQTSCIAHHLGEAGDCEREVRVDDVALGLEVCVDVLCLERVGLAESRLRR